MEEAVIDQMTMPYLRMGCGEPLVLLHGFTESKEGWFKQFELANHYDLIIPDQRGHGHNRTLEGISIENLARDVIELLDLLNIESAHICGFSMGGAVAQEIYRQAPEKCQSLVLACTTFYLFYPLNKIFTTFITARKTILPTNLLKIITARSCFYSWNSENFEALEKCLKPNGKAMQVTMDALTKIDNRALLPKIDAPTLVICGKFDLLIPLWLQIDMHNQIPNSELVILNKAGHEAKIESAKEFNQNLRQFLGKHPIE